MYRFFLRHSKNWMKLKSVVAIGTGNRKFFFYFYWKRRKYILRTSVAFAVNFHKIFSNFPNFLSSFEKISVNSTEKPFFVFNLTAPEPKFFFRLSSLNRVFFGVRKLFRINIPLFQKRLYRNTVCSNGNFGISSKISTEFFRLYRYFLL